MKSKIPLWKRKFERTTLRPTTSVVNYLLFWLSFTQRTIGWGCWVNILVSVTNFHFVSVFMFSPEFYSRLRLWWIILTSVDKSPAVKMKFKFKRSHHAEKMMKPYSGIFSDRHANVRLSIWNSNDDSLCVLKFDNPEFLILATLYSDRFHHLYRISSALLMSQWTTTMLWSIHGGWDVRLDNEKLLKLKNCRLTLFVTSSFLQLCMIKHDSHSCFLIVRLFSHVTQPMESAVVVIKTRPNLEARENRTERH